MTSSSVTLLVKTRAYLLTFIQQTPVVQRYV
jgi:hypothetical protein